MDIQDTAVSRGFASDRLCGGMSVHLRVFHRSVVYTCLRHSCHRLGHDDFAGTVFRGNENLDAGISDKPVWNIAVRVFSSGAGG